MGSCPECPVGSQLTAIRIRVQLMAIPQDAFIARHAARYRLCVCGTSALDFARHCEAAVVWKQPEREPFAASEGPRLSEVAVRTKPVSPFFESPRRLASRQRPLSHVVRLSGLGRAAFWVMSFQRERGGGLSLVVTTCDTGDKRFLYLVESFTYPNTAL